MNSPILDVNHPDYDKSKDPRVPPWHGGPEVSGDFDHEAAKRELQKRLAAERRQREQSKRPESDYSKVVLDGLALMHRAGFLWPNEFAWMDEAAKSKHRRDMHRGYTEIMHRKQPHPDSVRAAFEQAAVEPGKYIPSTGDLWQLVIENKSKRYGGE